MDIVTFKESASNSNLRISLQTLVHKLTQQEYRRMIFWDQCDPFIDLRMQWRASMIRHLFHILPGQRILEVGAGNGKFTQAMSEVTRHECEMTAVVFLDEYVEKVHDATQKQNVQVRHLNSFPGILDGEKFDYVIAHYMLEDETRNAFLHAVKSLIKPGGGLILFEANPWNPYYRLRRGIQRLIPLNWKRPLEPISLNRIQVFEVLSELGYTQINALPYDFLYSPIPKFLLWPAQNLSLIMENMPFIRNFAGALYIWARNPSPENYKPPVVNLSEHAEFHGKVSFVVPCHNEEMNVPLIIKGIKDFYGEYIQEIIIVDDNSKDRTAEVTLDLARQDNRIKLIRRSPPNGVGRALRDGLREAQGEFVLIMDSDFQHIIPEMRDLFDAIARGADVAVGSRFSRRSVLVNYPFTKILANRGFHVLANIFLGRHFRDISNNLKILRKDVVNNLVIESDDFAVNVETGLKPMLMGYTVEEVPISWVNRTVVMGLSTFKIVKTGPNYFKLLCKLVWRKMTGQLKQRSKGLDQDKGEEKQFFDSWAENKIYTEYGHFTPYGHQTIIEHFHKFIGKRLGKGRKAIDLGCGAGSFDRRLFKDVGATCLGVDISLGLIRAARRYETKVQYLVGDIEHLAFPDGSFDVVILSGVLHHFLDSKKCLKESYRILKKGGCLLAYDPNIKNPFMWLYKEASSTLFSQSGQTENEKIFSPAQAQEKLEEAGFKNVNINCISGVTFKYVGSRVGMFLLPVYNGIEYLWGKSPLAHKYGSFLISYGEK